MDGSDSSEDDFSDESNTVDDSYDSEGVMSDDDAGECCHWSRNVEEGMQGAIRPDDNLTEYGKPIIEVDDDTKPRMIVEKIMDDDFIKQRIKATNEHGSSDPKFIEKINEIPCNEKGINFVCGFIAIKWHLRPLRYRQMKWAIFKTRNGTTERNDGTERRNGTTERNGGTAERNDGTERRNGTTERNDGTE